MKSILFFLSCTILSGEKGFVLLEGCEKESAVCFGLYKSSDMQTKNKIQLPPESKRAIKKCLKQKIESLILTESEKNLKKFNLRSSDPLQIQRKIEKKPTPAWPMITDNDPTFSTNSLIEQMALQQKIKTIYTERF